LKGLLRALKLKQPPIWILTFKDKFLWLVRLFQGTGILWWLAVSQSLLTMKLIFTKFILFCAICEIDVLRTLHKTLRTLPALLGFWHKLWKTWKTYWKHITNIEVLICYLYAFHTFVTGLGLISDIWKWPFHMFVNIWKTLANKWITSIYSDIWKWPVVHVFDLYVGRISYVCNFSFPKQVNHRLVCFQVCKHMKHLFLYQTYESYIGTLIISHVCKHMKWPFSYVWDFFFSKHMNLMLAKFICLQTYETAIFTCLRFVRFQNK